MFNPMPRKPLQSKSAPGIRRIPLCRAGWLEALLRAEAANATAPQHSPWSGRCWHATTYLAHRNLDVVVPCCPLFVGGTQPRFRSPDCGASLVVTPGVTRTVLSA